MPQNLQERIAAALSTVVNPRTGSDVVASEMVRDIATTLDGRVRLTMLVGADDDPALVREVRVALERVYGVKEVRIDVRDPSETAAKSRAGQQRTLPVMDDRPAAPRPQVPPPVTYPHLGHILAVSSGKGGVGKSTVAVNLAAALRTSGARVGLLDADIYGPAVPIMLGHRQQAEVRENRILPAEHHGLRFISMGLFVPGDKPLIWRGPMAHKALQQCLFDVEWGELDYLLVDLPPGTGDVHLTLAQSVPVTGAVIVSTPQDVGLVISMKTLRMFQQTNIPILGIVENMSYYVCSHCGAREEIFGHGGARRASEELGVPFLGEIPIDVRIRRQADTGTPIVLADPESPAAQAYRAIAERLAAQISIVNYQMTPLRIEDVST